MEIKLVFAIFFPLHGTICAVLDGLMFFSLLADFPNCDRRVGSLCSSLARSGVRTSWIRPRWWIRPSWIRTRWWIRPSWIRTRWWLRTWRLRTWWIRTRGFRTWIRSWRIRTWIRARRLRRIWTWDWIPLMSTEALF